MRKEQLAAIRARHRRERRTPLPSRERNDWQDIEPLAEADRLHTPLGALGADFPIGSHSAALDEARAYPAGKADASAPCRQAHASSPYHLRCPR